jgi:hypothetical protein
MKTVRFIFGLLSLVLLIISGCVSNELNDGSEYEYRTNDVLYPKNAKLKRILQVFSDNSSNEFARYEYDEQGRILKVISPTSNAYDLYEYNEKGQVIHIVTYMAGYENPLTYVIYRKLVNTYDENGNKIKELIDGAYTVYEYENNKLIRSEHYTDDNFDFYRLYEYNALGEMVKEYFNVPDVEGEPVITEHTYNEGLLVYSVTRSEKNFMWDSKKIYDMNDNLIMKIDNIPGLSSMSTATAFYETRRYEY